MKYLGEANGLQGILCRTIGGQYFLRVPKKRGKYIDVALRHFDLNITVTDPEGALYRIGNEYVLDHAPETLGIRIPRSTKSRRAPG